MTQLSLDLGLDRPVTAVTICHRCGALVEAVEIPDAGDSWNEAVLWGYVAIKAHEPQCPQGSATGAGPPGSTHQGIGAPAAK